MGIGNIQPAQSENAAAELRAIDALDDSVLIANPELQAEADAFAEQLQANTLNRDLQKADPNVEQAAESAQKILELIEEFGIAGKIPANATFQELLDSGTGLANFVDNPGAQLEIQREIEKLNTALDGEKNLEGKAADLLTAAGNSNIVAGSDMAQPGLSGGRKDAHGADQNGMGAEEKIVNLSARELLAMSPEARNQVMNQLSPMEAMGIQDEMNKIVMEDPVAAALMKEQMQGMKEKSMMGGDGMMEPAGSAEDINDILVDGAVEETRKQNKGASGDDAEAAAGGGGGGAGGGGSSVSIRNIAAVLGDVTDKNFERAIDAAEGLGEDATPGEALVVQGEFQVSSAVSKAAQSSVDETGKAAKESVKGR